MSNPPSAIPENDHFFLIVILRHDSRWFYKMLFFYGVFMPLMSLILTAKVKINNCYSAVYFSVSFFFSRKEHVVNFWLIYIEMVPDYFVFIAQWNLWWMPSHAQLKV